MQSEDGNSPPYGWLSQGVIIFQGVYLKYREHIPPSLNGVSFEIRPAEKVGIVGRTGAGKSSLFAALLRLVNLASGKIIIDTVNINHISLQSLRLFFLEQYYFSKEKKKSGFPLYSI